MKLKTTLIVLALVATPNLAAAMGCGFGHGKADTANISCAEGLSYDATLGQCVDKASS
jgi:hypothetical protein